MLEYIRIIAVASHFKQHLAFLCRFTKKIWDDIQELGEFALLGEFKILVLGSYCLPENSNFCIISTFIRMSSEISCFTLRIHAVYPFFPLVISYLIAFIPYLCSIIIDLAI